MIRRVILAYCILTTCTVAEKSTTYGLVGETVTLNTDVKNIPDDILWKHNGNKVVEFNGQEQHGFGSFLNRITLDWSSADLTITDLSYEDSGEYVLEIHNKDLAPSNYKWNYKLEVIDKVAKPTMSCKMNTNSSSSTSANQATLMCSSEPGRFQSLMKFEWSSHEKSGQDVTIPLGDEHDDQVYTCTVSNPVSKELTTFTAKDCYKGNGPGARIAGSDSDSAAGIGIGFGVIFAIAFVILLVGLLFCKLKHKACFARKGNDEEQASYGSTEESEYHRGPTPSRAPTFVSNQPLLPYGKNNTRSKYGEEDESLLHQSERQESNDDTEEESKAEHLGNVHQEVERIEEETQEQKPEVSESDKNGDEDEETITTSANAPSAVRLLSEDDEHKEDANSDQDSDKTTTEKNAEESEPSGNRLEEETTSPEQKGEEATVNETNSVQADMETHSGEDNQQDTHKNVSNDEPVVDKEDDKTVKNLPLENSQQPQSLITPEPDHINTNTCQETSDTEQAASDLEEKENNSDSDSGTEETDEGEADDKNKVQLEPEDGKPDNESFSGDKEVEKKSEAAE